MYSKIEFTHKKKAATGFLGYIPTLLFLIMGAFGIFGVIKFINKEILIGIICFIILLCLYGIVYLMSKIFDWFLSGTVTYYKDRGLLEYIEKGVLEIGSSKSTYKMKQIDKVIKRKNSIWLYGNIDAIECIHKTKLKKLELKTYDMTESVYQLVMNFYNDNKES